MGLIFAGDVKKAQRDVDAIVQRVAVKKMRI